MTFDHLGLSADILRAVADEGYTEPTPIQDKAVPFVLAGRDVGRGRVPYGRLRCSWLHRGSRRDLRSERSGDEKQ